MASLKVRSHQTRMKRYVRIIYMLSQCKDTIDNPVALFAWMARIMRRELSIWRAIHAKYCELKNPNFGGYSRRAVTSLRAEAENLKQIWNGGQSNCGCMWVPRAVYTSSYFYKTGIHFAMRLELPGRSPSHDAYSCLLCSEFHARMAWISHANEASKLKMFKHPTTRE